MNNESLKNLTRIGAVISAPLGACSYYRSVGPYSKIKNVVFNTLDKGNWSAYANIDLIYLERPVLGVFVEGIQLAKNFNLPVIIDFDDDLFNIPDYNPAHDFYEKPEIRDNIKRACQLANCITVTTPALKKLYSEWNDNVVIIENAWNNINFPIDRNEASDNRFINWRGSATHRNDLLEYKNAILKASDFKKDWCWSWMGKEHWMISDFVKNKKLYDESEIIKYFNNLKELAPAIQMVPLHNNIFNESKSNISWIEATWAGAVTIAPNLPEWKRPGIFTFETSSEFFDIVMNLTKNPDVRHTAWLESKKFINENLLINEINKKRIAVINDLLEKK
jgi:hypothetical protein